MSLESLIEKKGEGMLADGRLTLAAQAGWTVVIAADTDTWDTVKRGFARLLGQGSVEQAQLGERRLEETREQLDGVAQAQREEVRTTLAERWAGRLADLMEEQDVEADLRTLVKEIQAALPARVVSAFDHAVTIEKDMSLQAAYGDEVTQSINRAVSAEPDQTTLLPRLRDPVLELQELDGNVSAQVSLVSWIGEAGNAPAARDQFVWLVPVCERVLGPEHPDTLAARGELAYWTGRAGDAPAARDQFAWLVPVCERVLGPEHLDTLTSRHNLANYVGYTGDAAGARDQFAELVSARERILGPDHPDTLATRHQLAYWTAQVGDVAGARDQFAALLSAYEEVLGSEHPDTLATRASLAQLTDTKPRRFGLGRWRRAH